MTLDKSSLDSQINGTVLVEGDEGYEKQLKRWAENAERKAAYVALVENAEDISKTVVWATENKLDLAIRGGGHSCSAASSTEGGLVIDLSRMREVKVDADKRLAYAQGGALWSDFNTATTDKGLVSVGGTVSHTGIGGLILGGGYGWLTGQYGLSLDNLVEATVIVADGRIVKANAKENSDLFWAIKGGGSNFGVISEFVVQLHPHPGKCFGGMIIFTADKLVPLVAALNKIWEKNSPKFAFSLAVAAPPPTFEPALVVVPFIDTMDETEARAELGEIYALGPVADHTQIHPYAQQNKCIDGLATYGDRKYMKGFAFRYFNPALVDYVLQQVTSFLEIMGPDDAGSAILLEAHPFDKLNSVPLDATAFANRGEYFNSTIAMRWKNSDKDEFVRNWTKTFVAGARVIENRMAEERKETVIDGGYANMDMPGDKATDAFKTNLPRLTELKRKWDPNGRFNKWFPIPVAA